MYHLGTHFPRLQNSSRLTECTCEEPVTSLRVHTRSRHHRRQLTQQSAGTGTAHCITYKSLDEKAHTGTSHAVPKRRLAQQLHVLVPLLCHRERKLSTWRMWHRDSERLNPAKQRVSKQ